MMFAQCASMVFILTPSAAARFLVRVPFRQQLDHLALARRDGVARRILPQLGAPDVVVQHELGHLRRQKRPVLPQALDRRNQAPVGHRQHQHLGAKAPTSTRSRICALGLSS